MDEFVREVKMLDKFRCDFIVHFFGACSIRNHVMMTGFAPRESLMDCIKKPEEPSADIKEKVMVDAAPGLAYLHANGIPHGDIHPDNVIVFSFDQVLEGNGKLNDFGSSRNVNMRMSNMTFAKGSVSPTNLAQEVLNKAKYKKASDVFSFGVTLYECFKWGEAYPKEQVQVPVVDLFIFPEVETA